MYAAAVRLFLILMICCAVAPAARADQADDQFAVAAGHYTAKRWQLAIDEFRTFLREYPEHAKKSKAQFFQGEALVQIGKHGDAYPLFVEVLADEPNGAYAKQSLFRAAEAAFMSGRTDEAQLRMSQFRTKYANDKLNGYLVTYQADLALRSKDETGAERLYRESLERYGDMPTADECRFALAKILEKQKKTAEAEKLWRVASQGNHRPWNEMALLKLASVEAEKKNFNGAFEITESFEKRFATSELSPQAKLIRGRALYELGRYTAARETLSPLVADAELAEDARYWLALTQKAEKKFNEAAETLKAALEAEKKKAEQERLAKENPPKSAPKPEPVEKSPVAKGTIPTEKPESPVAAEKTAEKTAEKAIAKKPEPSPEQVRRRAVAMRYHAAEALLRAGDFARAIDTLKAGDNSGDDPTTLSTRYLLAISLQGIKKHDEALQTLRELDGAIERKLQSPGMKTLTVNANGLRRLDSAGEQTPPAGSESAANKTSEAINPSLSAEDQTALAALRDNTRLATATSLIAIEKFNAAIEPLQAYLASGRQDVGAERARSALAICLARTERVDAARLILDELKTHHPESKTVLTTTHHVAEAAYAAEQYQVAYDLFAELSAEGNPSELIAKGLAGMGWSRQQLGEHETAAEIFGEFLQLFPTDSRAVDVTLARGQALEQLGKNEAALTLYKQAVGRYRQSPQLPQILLASARMHDQLGHDEEAVSLYQRIVREFPKANDVDAAVYGWAWALRDLGRGSDSDKVFRQLHAQYPNSRFWADASFRLAERAAQRGDRQQATALIKPLLEGNCPPAVLQHALYLNAQMAVAEERWKEAETPLRRLIEEHPDSVLRLPAEFWYAEIAYRAADYAAAKYRFDSLTHRIRGVTEPWVAIVPLRRAQMMMQEKQWPQARELAESIERDFPEFDQQYEADYVIGRCLVSDADFDNARALFQKVVRSPGGGKTETAAMAQWMIGESYYHQEKYDAALREYLRVEILYPYPRWQSAALLQAGKCHEELGHFKEAAELYNHLLKKHPDSEFVEEAKARLQETATRPAKPSATDQVGELKSVLRKQ
jgi:cellulose synthase operon protein C